MVKCFVCEEDKLDVSKVHEELKPVCNRCLKQMTIYVLEFEILMDKLKKSSLDNQCEKIQYNESTVDEIKRYRSEYAEQGNEEATK